MNKTAKVILAVAAIGAAGAGLYFWKKKKYANPRPETEEPKEPRRYVPIIRTGATEKLVEALGKAEELLEPYTSREDSIRETYPEVDEDLERAKELSRQAVNKPSIIKDVESRDLGMEDDQQPEIEIVTLEELGRNEEYEVETYDWMEDGYLIDRGGMPVENFEETMGTDFIDLLDSENNVVGVKNNRLHMYYEICWTGERYLEDDEE